MKLVPEIIDRDAHREFRRFLDNFGRKNWERKIAKIHALPAFRSPSPNTYRNYLANRNPLTRDIEVYLNIDREGKLLQKHLTLELMKTCGHLKIINALFHQCETSVSDKIKSILLDDETVRSFLFELEISTHFFACGLDVQLVDLQGLGTFDLLVSDGKSELEVECKTKSADAGRKITRHNFYLLCDVLAVALSSRLTQSFAVFFKCDGRLSGRQDLFYKVADQIERCTVEGQNQGKVDTLSFEIRSLSPDIKIRTHEEAAAALAPHWSPDAHYFVLSGGQTLILGCESTDRDRVLKAIYEDLKHGAGQLSGTRPAILACQLEDIDDENWSELRGETGLAAMSGRLLGSSERRHVNFVVYSSNKTLPKEDAGIMNFSATTLRFQNKNAQYSFPTGFFH
jgi:hypothetical protein